MTLQKDYGNNKGARMNNHRWEKERERERERERKRDVERQRDRQHGYFSRRAREIGWGGGLRL